MKKNMGTIDRAVRLFIAALFIALYFAHFISGTIGVILLVIAGIFFVTGVGGICPLYMVLGLNTCGYKKGHDHGDKVVL